jgi:hypothetical protein
MAGTVVEDRLAGRKIWIVTEDGLRISAREAREGLWTAQAEDVFGIPLAEAAGPGWREAAEAALARARGRGRRPCA